MMTRVFQIGCFVVAGYLFLSITGVQLPQFNSAEAQEVVRPTARVVVNPRLSTAPAVVYVTATPEVSNIETGPVQVVIIPEPTQPIDVRQLGPIEPAQANATAVVINSDPELRVECTRAQWEKLSQQNFPAPSGCTVVVDP